MRDGFDIFNKQRLAKLAKMDTEENQPFRAIAEYVRVNPEVDALDIAGVFDLGLGEAANILTKLSGEAGMRRELKDKLSGFSELGKNWDSYEGLPINEKAIYQAGKFIDSMSLEGISQINVCPLSSGGVEIEWKLDGVNISLIFEVEASDG